MRDGLNGCAALAVGISLADAPVRQCSENGKRPTTTDSVRKIGGAEA